jgi:hypothetical protein
MHIILTVFIKIHKSEDLTPLQVNKTFKECRMSSESS